jgi:hypothetical protein
MPVALFLFITLSAIIINSPCFGDQMSADIEQKLSKSKPKLSEEERTFVVMSLKSAHSNSKNDPTLSVNQVQTDGQVITENGVRAWPPSRVSTATVVAATGGVDNPGSALQHARDVAEAPIKIFDIISSLGAATQLSRGRATVEADSKAYFSDHAGAAGRLYEVVVEHSVPNEAGIDAELVKVYALGGGGTKDDEIYYWANNHQVLLGADDKFSLLYVDTAGGIHPINSDDVINVYDGLNGLKSGDYIQEMDQRIRADRVYEEKSNDLGTQIQQASDKNDATREAALRAQREHLDQERENELKEEKQRDDNRDQMRELEDKSRDGAISREEQIELDDDVEREQASQNIAMTVDDPLGNDPIQCKECSQINLSTLKKNQFLGNYQFRSQINGEKADFKDVKIYVTGTDDAIATVRNLEGLGSFVEGGH